VARAFPPRPECPDIPDISAIEGELVNISQEVSDPPPPAYQFPAFELPMPNPPASTFGCYGISAQTSLNADSSGSPISSSSIDPYFEAFIRYPSSSETGVCQPVFDFKVNIPPCAAISLGGQVSMSQNISTPEMSVSGGRDPNSPCASIFDFEFRLPCNTVNVSALVSIVPSLVDPEWNVTSSTGSGVCVTDFTLDLRLPEFGEDDVCQARMASTGNLARNGIQTIDGVAGADGDVVLLKDQTVPRTNGAYIMRSGFWERTCEMRGGIIVTVREGDENGATAWMLTTNDPIIVNTTPLDFELISGAACCCYARAATTDDITLSGTQTIDGISLSADEICLVKNQATASENGPYFVKSGAWERTCEIASGMTVSVREGQANELTTWVLKTNDPIVVDTTNLSFEKLRAPGNATVRLSSGSNVTLSGLQTIDGVAGSDGDRILLTGQSSASENGIYVMRSGSWERAEAEWGIVEGMLVSVRSGGTLSGTVWVLTTSEPITVGSTNLTFVQITGAQAFYTVKAASTTNTTLSGARTLDGISCTNGDIVLVKEQSTASENGIYEVKPGAWTKLAPAGAQILAAVLNGTINGRTFWMVESDLTTWNGMGTFVL